MASPHSQKLRAAGPLIVTANRLSDGAVVHRAKAGGWTRDLSAAAIYRAVEEAQKALKAAQAEGLEAVGPYLAPIGEGASRPGNLRELIRASGPTFALPGEAQERVAA